MFMNGRVKRSYERQNSYNHSLHHIVIIGAEEARRASILLYNNGDDSYLLGSDHSSINVHDQLGIQPVPHYGSHTTKNYFPTTHDYRYGSPVYGHPTTEKADEGFSPNFQSRAKQPNMMGSPPTPNSYGRPNLQFEEEKSTDNNHVFNSLRDLYLESREGTSPKTKGKDDYKRFNSIFSKPANNIGSVKSLPTQGAEQAQLWGPSSKSPPPNSGEKASKTIDKKEAMENHDGARENIKSDYRPYSKPTDAIGIAKNLPTQGLEAVKNPEKYSPPPNSGEKISKATDIKSSRPFTKPMYNFGSAKNSPTKAPATEQAPFRTSVSLEAPAKKPDIYVTPQNSGQKNSKTTERKESPEKRMSIYDYKIGGRSFTKPTDDTGTDMNLLTEGNNNVPPATKKAQFGIGIGREGAKKLGSKEAVVKYDGAFVPLTNT